MALMGDGSVPSFGAVAAEAYRDASGATIRDGVLADRFDCDKLLRYAPEVYRKIAVTGKVRVLDTLRGEFSVVPGGLTLAQLPPHSYAAVRFALKAGAMHPYQ